MVLWSNDPELVVSIRREAEQGNVDAQYALGLAYAEGRGIEPDNVQAYMWLSLAVEQGDEDARMLRYIVAENMSLEQVRQAEGAAADFQRRHLSYPLH
jgi:TPR repeat protein